MQNKHIGPHCDYRHREFEDDLSVQGCGQHALFDSESQRHCQHFLTIALWGMSILERRMCLFWCSPFHGAEKELRRLLADNKRRLVDGCEGNRMDPSLPFSFA